MKLREGDVLQLGLPDGRLGYAVVVDRGVLPSGGTPYLAVFGLAYAYTPDMADLAKDTIKLAGWTTDALVYYDKWKVAGHAFPIPMIPLPNFKVVQDNSIFVTDFRGKFIELATPNEIAALDYQFSVTAGIFQDAFEAMHGFGDWKDHYQRLTLDYARERTTRPSLSAQ